MMLRQFQLLRPIAEGGMGVVYRAFDTTLEREVAVKLMKSELADDKEVVEGFYREARACACLNHANIIHIYTFDELQDMRYLVMEVADNGSLDGRIEDHGALEELLFWTWGSRWHRLGFGPDPTCCTGISNHPTSCSIMRMIPSWSTLASRPMRIEA